MMRDQLAFLTGLERGCVEDQPQHARKALRLTLRAQPRSDGMFTTQPSGEKCGLEPLESRSCRGHEADWVPDLGFAGAHPTPKMRFEETLALTSALSPRRGGSTRSPREFSHLL